MAPFRIGILIIGSLYWRDEPVRSNWRNTRLDVERTTPVRAQIRYGRKSGSKTYTMTFTPHPCIGTALVVPCRSVGTEFAQLQAEAEALWGAESNKGAISNVLSKDWGTVGAMFKDTNGHPELLSAWGQYFKAAGGKALECVNTAGIIDLPWPERVDGHALDLDVLLATANVETGSPSAEDVADAWLDHPENGEYFFQNVRHGIRTQENAAIWRRLENRGGEQLMRVTGQFPEAVATLRKSSSQSGP